MKQTKAQFIGGSIFWETFCAFRVCWFRGRFGGGKTLLSVLMAARLLAENRVQSVVSNIPLTFASSPTVPLKSSAIILDESWIFIETRKDVMDYAAFVRKFNHYLLLPSVFPVHNRLSFFYVQRVFNGYTVGVPCWFYRWGLRDKDVKEYGYFGLWNPKAAYFHYPTEAVGGDDGGISDALAATAKMAGFKGTRTQQQRTSAAVSIDLEGMGPSDMEETLDDFSHTMDDQLAEFEKQGVKIIRSNRR